MAKAAAVEDMRKVDPVAYVRATGLRPEDPFGFCPDFDNSGIYFAWRKR